jgi:flotillin
MQIAIVNSALPIIAAVIVILVIFLQIVILLSRYTKVGPNQILVVSGRQRRLPDGTVIGFRVVKGGGTFVFPVLEKVDVLSLDVLTVEMPRTKARAAGGSSVEVDGMAQIKINGDDASIIPAMEFFLGKKSDEIPGIVRPVLEKHVVEVLGGSSAESIVQNPAACAAAVQKAAAGDLAKMGLSLISVTLRNARGV